MYLSPKLGMRGLKERVREKWGKVVDGREFKSAH
jgi:hypothetical protein